MISVAHVWNVGDLIGTVLIGTPLNDPISLEVYTLERVFGNSSTILSVTAFAGRKESGQRD